MIPWPRPPNMKFNCPFRFSRTDESCIRSILALCIAIKISSQQQAAYDPFRWASLEIVCVTVSDPQASWKESGGSSGGSLSKAQKGGVGGGNRQAAGEEGRGHRVRASPNGMRNNAARATFPQFRRMISDGDEYRQRCILLQLQLTANQQFSITHADKWACFV